MARKGREPNGAGTLTQLRSGAWRCRTSAPDGSRLSAVGDTPEAAREAARAKLAAVRQARASGDPNATVTDWLRQWLNECETRVRPSTWRSYEGMSRLHIVPIIGDIKLRELTRDDISELHSALQRKRRLGSTSCHHIHVMLSTALEAAVLAGAILHNPCSRIKGPRIVSRTKVILTAEQAQKLLATAYGHPDEALIALGLTAGMRVGEITALRWENVMFHSRKLLINATQTRSMDGAPLFGEPKTKRSKRLIPLPETAIAALRRRQEIAGTDERVYQGYSGFMALKHFHAMLRKADLPKMPFHDLRHSCATLLLEAGVSAHVVAELLGHSSVAVTLGMYGHVTREMRNEAATVMERVLNDSTALQVVS